MSLLDNVRQKLASHDPEEWNQGVQAFRSMDTFQQIRVQEMLMGVDTHPKLRCHVLQNLNIQQQNTKMHAILQAVQPIIQSVSDRASQVSKETPGITTSAQLPQTEQVESVKDTTNHREPYMQWDTKAWSNLFVNS